MSTKGRDKSVKEKRGRSPLLSRKIETIQQRRLNPSPTLGTKNEKLTTEYKRVSTYDNPTVSSRLHARSPIKQRTSFHKTKVLPQAKVMSPKSKFNETRTKDVGKLNPPLKLKNPSYIKKDNVDVKKRQTQMTEVIEKKPRLFDAPSSSKDDRNSVIHEEDDHKTTTLIVDHEDNEILAFEVEREDGGNVPLYEPSVPIDLREDQDMVESNTCSQDHLSIDETISQQHEANTFSCNDSNDHDPGSEIDQETQDVEEEQDVDLESNEETESKDVEHEEKESRCDGGGEEVPKEEEQTSKMVVKNQQVVAHGKKETAAYNDVREEACMLREQRRNRVKALVGAFESAILQR